MFLNTISLTLIKLSDNQIAVLYNFFLINTFKIKHSRSLVEVMLSIKSIIPF